MPYSFLFSFAMRGTGLTRMTNGCLESYNGFRKNNIPKNRLPHRHIRDSYEPIVGQAIEYLDVISKATNSKKKKTFESASEDEECEGDKKHKCFENYAKMRKRSFQPPTQRNMGYQRTVDIEMVETQSKAKSIFKNKKCKKSSPLQADDIDNLLISTNWLNNFVIEAYISTQVKENSTFIINSVAAHSILINKQYKDDLLNEVCRILCTINYLMKNY